MSAPVFHPHAFRAIFVVSGDMAADATAAGVNGHHPTGGYPHPRRYSIPVAGGSARFWVNHDGGRTIGGRRVGMPTVDVRANNHTTDETTNRGGNLVTTITRANRRCQGSQGSN